MATKKATQKGSMDMKAAAEKVIRDAGKPLHYRDVTKRMLKAELITTKGKTVEQSVSAKLATCAKREDTFKRTAPGVYDLLTRKR